MDTYDVDDARMLHRPDRADHLESLEEHLNIAARLSRALWELAASPDLSTERTSDRGKRCKSWRPWPRIMRARRDMFFTKRTRPA